MPVITIIEHEEDVDARRLVSALDDLGASIQLVRPWNGEDVSSALPPDGSDLPAPDAIVVLGGRMSAYDDERAPWLPDVRALLVRCMNEGVRTLGICLGHQLIARAAGGSVACSDPQFHEMGIVPVEWEAPFESDAAVPMTPVASATGAAIMMPAVADQLSNAMDEGGPWIRLVDDLSRIPVVFADHNDAIDELPAQARVLARSERCIHSIAVGSHALGVQFHPEVDRAWVEQSLSTSGLSQDDANQILDDFDRHERDIVAGCRRLAQWLVSGL